MDVCVAGGPCINSSINSISIAVVRTVSVMHRVALCNANSPELFTENNSCEVILHVPTLLSVLGSKNALHLHVKSLTVLYV